MNAHAPKCRCWWWGRGLWRDWSITAKEDDICALTEKRILIGVGDILEDLRGGVVPEPASRFPESQQLQCWTVSWYPQPSRSRVQLRPLTAILQSATVFHNRCKVLPKKCVIDVACCDDENGDDTESDREAWLTSAIKVERRLQHNLVTGLGRLEVRILSNV